MYRKSGNKRVFKNTESFQTPEKFCLLFFSHPVGIPTNATKDLDSGAGLCSTPFFVEQRVSPQGKANRNYRTEAGLGRVRVQQMLGHTQIFKKKEEEGEWTGG